MGKAIGKGIEVVETFLKELDKPPKAAVKVIKTQGVHDSDVKMSRGGAMPKKTTVMEDIQSLGDPAMALADMLAGKLRGTTAAATGFYGDIEDLVRKYGKGLPANVIRALLPTREGKETLLPTVEEMNAMLPPVVPKGAARSTQVGQVYNDLGMANPLAPTAGAAVVKGAKAVAPVLKAGALDLARSEPARRALNRVAQAAGASPMDIMAYQGSPHLYAATPKNPLGELDPTKIGSGEGAQAYGMGHYLAENRNVGEGYRNSISSQHGQDVTVGGVPVDEYYMAVYGNADQLPMAEAKQQYDKAALIEMLGFNRSPNDILSYAEDMGYAPSVIDWFKTDVMPKTKMPGYLYTHDLSDEAIARMLDWDKPLSEQSQHVKDALSKSDYAFRDMAYDLTGDPDPTGGHISRTGMNPKEFAEHMRSLGVPGVKYLDQESKARQAMDPEFTGGTRNFVLFPGEEDASKIIRREKTGGAVMMGAGGTVKKGIELVDTFLNALKEGEKAATAADRAAAGRAGAALIKATPQVKASEALGQAREQGFKKTTTTQSDRTRVGGGNIGGAPFSAISEADPRYAGKVWGVMDQGTASRLANLTSPDTAWSTMLGSATQLKTNPVVFAKLEKQFKKGLKEGRLQPELEDKINQNLGLFLGESANIRDPEIWKMLDTFEKRAAMADIMMGKGVPPSKGGVPLGGEKSGKGVIFNPTQTLIEETERGLLHPEHGGYVPTFAVGPRLFSLTGESSFRPDLHPGFPTLLKGKDLGVNMMATPTEVYLPDWHARFKANNPDRQGPGYYDLALGVKGEGLPSQELTDDYIRHLIREGYAEGGSVNMAAGGVAKKALEKATPVVDNAIKDAVESLRGYIDPIATKISEWNWRPMTDVRQEVPATEVPEYIQKSYGEFMADQAKRAAAGDLNARDLIKAYTITRSSVNRGGLPYTTATKTGMQLPPTKGLVRPEGAFAEWLGSKAGQRYLDQAEQGTFTESDLDDMMARFAPFGMPAVLADDMRYAARSLSPRGATISADVMASPEVYREVSQQLKGIGPAKSGFMASLLGRGDYPTFDARQIRLHTGQGGKDAAKYMTRGKGVGGEEAVARLADRQRAMNMSIDPSLDPFYQHLVHHTVWDKIGNEQTTHDDLVKAMRGYADGGEVDSDGVTLDDFLNNQGY